MLTVKEYLLAAGLDVDPDDIKLVKHVSHELYIPIEKGAGGIKI